MDNSLQSFSDLISEEIRQIFVRAKFVETKKEHDDIFNYLAKSKIIKMYCDTTVSRKITPDNLATRYYKLICIDNKYYEESE